MNKSLLIKQNNELFDKIKILKSRNAALSSQIANYKAEIEELNAKISELEKKTTNNDITVEETPSVPLETLEEVTESVAEAEDIELPDEFNFASDVIGNIVIKAAGFINQLTESSKENKKELINLILGRTEIAKAEILNVISSEVTFEAKKELLDTQYNEAVEYFKSIMEQ